MTEGFELHMSEDTTVLVLEDEQGLAQLYATWLEERYEVQTATTATEARATATADVDVALIDRRLPDEPGDEVLSWLRARPSECRAAMLTAVHPGDDLPDLPVDDYLLKPVDRTTVIETVERLARVADRGERERRVASLAARLSTLEDHRRRPGTEAVADRLRERLRSAVSDLAGGADRGSGASGTAGLAPLLPDDLSVDDLPATGRVHADDGSGHREPGSDAGDAGDEVASTRTNGSDFPTEEGGRPGEAGGVDGSPDRPSGGSDGASLEERPIPADRDDPGPHGEATVTGGVDERSGGEVVIDHSGDPDADSPRDVNPRRDLPGGDDPAGLETEPPARSAGSVADGGEDGSVERFDGWSAITVRYDPATDRYVTSHEWDGPRSLVVTIVETVAVIEGRPPVSIETVHDRVDTHALDALFGDEDGIDGRVSFQYAGHHVTVDADGEVLVEAADD